MSSSSSSPKSSIYPEIRVPQQPPKHGNHDTTTTPGVMNYVAASVDVAHVRRAPNGDDLPMQVTWNPVELTVHNARLDHDAATLDADGFELQAAPLSSLSDLNFLDSVAVMDMYYPACQALLQARLGDKVKVIAFDHNIRMAAAEPTSTALQNAGGSTIQVPLGMVHGDYTRVSAPRRLQQLAQPPRQNDVWRQRLGPGEALLAADTVAAALNGQRRYALMNVWRSIDTTAPVQQYPLACCRATSVTPAALRTLQIHYADRIGENYLAAHEATHEWCYYPHMTSDEVLLIKQWDSAGSLAQDENSDNDRNNLHHAMSTFALHSAFALAPEDDKDNASSPPPPRKSIEVRCVCIWEEDDDNHNADNNP